MTAKPIQLYSMAYQDRSDRVRWLMEELQIPYQDIFLKKKNGDMNTPEYRKLNPLGRVPTIVDDTTVIYESAAVCLYLADKYQSKVKLAPDVNSSERAEYLQWMVFSTASLECVVAKMFYLEGKTDEVKNAELAYIKEQCEILKLAIEPHLQKQKYFLKSGFSAVDILMAAVIPGAREFLAPRGSATEKWLLEMMERPLAKKIHVFE